MEITRVAEKFFKGVIRTIAGAAVAGVCALSAMAFYRVANDAGYLAVVDFVGGVALLVVSVEGIYFLGGGRSTKDNKK